MLKFILINSIAALVIAAVCLALVVLMGSMTPEAKADNAQPDTAAAPACVMQGWPYYEPRCQIDPRAGSGQTRTVRVIAPR